MQSGFSGGGIGGGGGVGGGGLPDFYTTGRSIPSTMNNNSHPYLRSPLPGLFLDPQNSQIGRQIQPQFQNQTQFQTHTQFQNQTQNPNAFIGKRTLAEFQAHQQYQHNNPNQNLYLRSLKPRNSFQHSSPISPLSPIDFSSASTITGGSDSSSSASSLMSHQRFGLPLLQQPINPSLPAMSYLNNNPGLINQTQTQTQTRVVSGMDSEKKIMSNKLQELEKQLLDDNDEDDEGDAVSVISKTNSEWSETIQNLIGSGPGPVQSQKPVSPSPTSSSSSSSSVASPASSTCSKQSLMEAATAISDGKMEAATEILTRLTAQGPNPRPNSEQRLVEFMVSALKSRVNPVENPPPVKQLFSPEHAGSTQLLYELSPCFRLGFMAANLAILEATLTDQSTTSKVHVIDFDIGQGGQYMHLLHALSARQSGGPAVVKITTVAENGGEDRLRMVRQNLSQHAGKLGVGLEFNVVSQKLGELTRETLGCEPDEPIAVNFAFKLYSMPDESVSTDNPRDELLRRVKGLSPRVVTLVEQEVNTNTAPFTARVNETCAYYGAVLDSIEATATVPRDNPDRVRAEEALSRKLANSVACEGRDRVERCEVFGKWRARMGMAGFKLRPISQNVTESLKSRLSSGNRVHPGLTVKEENGGVCFGWISRTLTFASAWR